MQKGSSLRRHHIEINKALTALALVPLFTALLPIIVYNVGMFFCANSGQFMIHATFTLSLASIMNPITAIAMIKPYRRSFLGFFRFYKVKVNNDVMVRYTTTSFSPQ
ncbi:unnamed protein product [Bursaphelenchus okinawaensis]|uniref:Uncharacterized protein n=1 Tax=Bursaphelenchus okinawaensis TaxID=465554 RepID=A0A811L0J1_9BILA|nr:unnamed protein product [Bursaphelenchus okinawaensis]CAG9113999.1 unnamed protein product [Bursaphelenchus okinawaensis]